MQMKRPASAVPPPSATANPGPTAVPPPMPMGTAPMRDPMPTPFSPTARSNWGGRPPMMPPPAPSLGGPLPPGLPGPSATAGPGPSPLAGGSMNVQPPMGAPSGDMPKL